MPAEASPSRERSPGHCSPSPRQPVGTPAKAAWWQSCPPSSSATATLCTAPSGCSRRRALSASRRPRTGRYAQAACHRGPLPVPTIAWEHLFLHLVYKLKIHMKQIPEGTRGQTATGFLPPPPTSLARSHPPRRHSAPSASSASYGRLPGRPPPTEAHTSLFFAFFFAHLHVGPHPMAFI